MPFFGKRTLDKLKIKFSKLFQAQLLVRASKVPINKTKAGRSPPEQFLTIPLLISLHFLVWGPSPSEKYAHLQLGHLAEPPGATGATIRATFWTCWTPGAFWADFRGDFWDDFWGDFAGRLLERFFGRPVGGLLKLSLSEKNIIPQSTYFQQPEKT